ncbi:tripartite tricarboxylate transporter substrate binding protein [Roseomonas alkaliterrae]|uniref:Tripartite-type tricarboxylate transporter receptor subunit TctC n=1 Tax=Neoroseomonas alkaliterrae TaxID=1452450 RepID=A0A840Y9H8_9PROT|nr:tripartite tricarboxylate transporter substrate binding protein [Neoroseomonas alkaliterrae]MBB5690524.1 tripartite-type tricarboxylate transporter receptor subunit TctC [Neoroseomonas alkaliterrae]MBR0677329.1 tripartite tricarboxylate transporter substrate binding protein [Neoroseomonas alkaliterrae]
MLRRHLLGGAAGTLLAAPALGQAGFPNRPVRMIVPYPPGGATDAMSRLAAQKIQERLGATVVVENRSGANGQVGTQAVLQAPADGYTILGSASIHVMARHVMRNVPYDPVADFVPLARTARGPLVMVMSPQRPQRTIPEIVEAAKREPARWTFATSSLGAAGHLGTIEFNRVTGANIEIVAYRGTAPALTDVAAGNAQLMFDPVLATLPMIRGGQLRGLGIATRARTSLAPDLPTMAEAGLPGFEFYSWYGVWAPRGVPAEIVARFNAALAEGMREPAVVERLTGLGFEPVAESVAEAEAFIRADVARNAELLRIANFQPE